MLWVPRTQMMLSFKFEVWSLRREALESVKPPKFVNETLGGP